MLFVKHMCLAINSTHVQLSLANIRAHSSPTHQQVISRGKFVRLYHPTTLCGVVDRADDNDDWRVKTDDAGMDGAEVFHSGWMGAYSILR